MFDETLSPVVLFNMVSATDGSLLDIPMDDLRNALEEFEYDEHISKVGMLVFKFANPGGIFDDDPRLQGEDKLFQVRWGYLSALSPVKTCVLRFVQPDYRPDGSTYLDVICFDAVSRAFQVSNPRNWGNINTSDIAKRIAYAHGMVPIVPESSDDVRDKPYVQPGSLTDLRYLSFLARRRGWDCFCDGVNIYYGPDRMDDAPVLQAVYGSPQTNADYGSTPILLTGFRPSIDQGKRPDTRFVSLDPSSKEVVSHKTDDADSQGGLPERQALGKVAVVSFADRSVSTRNMTPEETGASAGTVKATAEKGAAQLQKDAQATHWRIHAKANAAEATFNPGSVEIRARRIIDVQNVAVTHSGLWKIVGAKHNVKAQTGYVTSATLKRPGKNTKQVDNATQLASTNKQTVDGNTSKTAQPKVFVADFKTRETSVKQL